ncbi:hypothetical protein CPB83DRAFT_757321 [Crepidotus variabilis]|uniref:Dicer-like protein 1 n=1 Tax=Crepidotus variabilis TaxID=179855 RepID=A0A9P6ES00_9AGAR|nr:hypothetical protein CPB83DRAFT_757321 [Crepidotus variabilis]
MGEIQNALDDHIPYRYQEEVFQQAQKENIIAALETGSGKTLISILLIKWIASQSKSCGKVIVFLVPRVTLVDQQKETIKKHAALKVTKLHGAMEIDLSDRVGWKRKLEKYDVFVMTAQVFLNLITHGLWSIKQVSLMIFDECHHTRRNHPYNNILREYHQLPPNQRPKIFGMTASPIWNTSKPEASISELESNMNAKIMGVRENIAELELNTPKPVEVIEVYPLPPEEYECPLTALYQCLEIIDSSTWRELDIPFDTLKNRYLATYNNTGPYAAAMFLYLELKRHLIRLNDADVGIECDGQGDLTSAPCASVRDERSLIRVILDEFRYYFPPDPFSHEIPVAVSLTWCTPKVKCLVDILLRFESQSPTFQCIVFVEQRQVASTLSKVLLVIPEANKRLRTGYLVGEGVNSDGVARESDRVRGDPIKLFRDGHLNVLIATSVAEEGLDFKECDLVVRFDGLQHMIAYVQSRGRARKQESTFVLMVRQDDEALMSKYHELKASEEAMASHYRTRHLNTSSEDDSDNETDDEGYFLDLVDRERYVVPSSGAVLTYDNSISLIGRLCSLIPHDSFTPAYSPLYEGGFQSTLRLPSALPLRAPDLVFQGPRKCRKKEAKRAVAFMAVVRLRELDVFDEYLLPVSSDQSESDLPLLGDRSKHTGDVPEKLVVNVRDPWCMGETLWLHPVVVSGHTMAGLVTGTSLPCTEVIYGGRAIGILPGKILQLDDEIAHERRKSMEQYTKRAIEYSVTASPFDSFLSLYLVPITDDYLPDFQRIDFLLRFPKGCSDWSDAPQNSDEYVMMCKYRSMSMHTLHQIRHDLTPLSIPLEGSREPSSLTYRDHWTQLWSKRHKSVTISHEGPLVECWHLPRSDDGSYPLNPSEVDRQPMNTASQGRLFPFAECLWMPIPSQIRQLFEALPALAQRITHEYRARSALRDLGLPPIPVNLLIETLTISSSGFSFNNQRLETLGDAVLQLCTTVHLLHKYPNRHEGQLSDLRQKVVSNRYLFHRALDNGLERFVNSEVGVVRKWRYVIAKDASSSSDIPSRFASREYPRRSLQDCMEAILAASFITGGIEMALRAGCSLGLEFGGPLPWFMRYKQISTSTRLPPLMMALEEKLGYKFKNTYVLREALTHPSSANRLDGEDCPSYQRLEFLGDAILDLVVVKYLYDKFPDATSHELSLSRARAICAPTLAYLAITRLELHKMMLIDSFDLNRAISRYIPILGMLSAPEIVEKWWKYDAPKPLSDVFESVIGAVLVDSGYDYERTAAVTEHVMEDVLEALSPSTAKDPISQLMEWCSGQGCTNVTFEKKLKEDSTKVGVAALVHGTVVVGPLFLTSRATAKFVAAEHALEILQDPNHPCSLTSLCVCTSSMAIDQDLELPQNGTEESYKSVLFLLSQMNDCLI